MKKPIMLYICFLFCLFRLICPRKVDIFSQEEKQKIDDARKRFLTSTDRIMQNWRIEDLKDKLFEGDMIVSHAQRKRWTETGYLGENTEPLIVEKWPSNTVNYQFGSPAPNKAVVKAAMKAWSGNTCIKFKETPTNAITITKGDGCYASLGHSSKMSMSVNAKCDLGTVVHLLGHVIGLVHQHSRPDRDQNLFIQFHNTAIEDILFLNYANFEKCPYDYSSVMQYDMYGLSYNGESVFLGNPTMNNVSNGDGMLNSSSLGYDWTKPTKSDIALVNREYDCDEKPCSDGLLKKPSCDQEVQAGQPQFSKIVAFKKMLTDKSRAISCIWKTYVPEKLKCARAAMAVTLAKQPKEDLKRVWYVSGCRLFQIEIYDPDADMSYFYCAAQFARKPIKTFISTGKTLYVIARLYPADWEKFLSTTLHSGEVQFFNIKDFLCTGEIEDNCL